MSYARNGIGLKRTSGGEGFALYLIFYNDLNKEEAQETIPL